MSETSIVNLYKAKYDVYIGRPGKGQTGYFGNPVAIGRTCVVCGNIHRDGGSTILCYTVWFNKRINEDETFKREVKALKGKVLGCFCKPNPCHGDVLVKYIDGV